MSAKAGFILILVDNLDVEVNFYRRVLGVRELKTWSDAHTEKAALFDAGPIRVILAQERTSSPMPHRPKAVKGRVWLGLQTSTDLGAAHQQTGVGRSPDQISAVHEALWGRGRCFFAVDPEGNPIVVGEQGVETTSRPRI
jgi:catechol 2,3-dioxygenase-like lactoylglutathione lyase family enzyme